MKRKFHDVQQTSPEWFELRKGRFTASTFKDLFAKPATQTYRDVIYQVAFERITNTTPENFVTEWMKRGSELEPIARELYELQTYNYVRNGGFFELGEWIGASPDGLIGEDGIIEIKCPKYTTFIDYVLNGSLPTAYKWQVHGQLYVADRQWCDFVAYHPNMPLFVHRVYRDEKMIKELTDQIELAINDAMSIIKQLKR